MAKTDWIRPESLIYLDSNVIVYFIERRDALQAKVADVLRVGVDAGCRFATSEAGVAECFYGAFKTGSLALQRAYEAFFRESAIIELLAVDGAQLIRAARFGGANGLKLLDASHVVSAMEADASHFLTNDRAIGQVQTITIVQLGDL